MQLLMEIDVEGWIGAGRREDTGERTTGRNRYWDRSLEAQLRSLLLRILALRHSSYVPPLQEACKMPEKALVAVPKKARIDGVSTRRANALGGTKA